MLASFEQGKTKKHASEMYTCSVTDCGQHPTEFKTVSCQVCTKTFSG